MVKLQNLKNVGALCAFLDVLMLNQTQVLLDSIGG